MFNSASLGTLTLTVAIAAVALGIGIGIGYLAFEPQSTEAASSLNASTERVMRLEASITEKDTRYQELLDQVAGFREQVAQANADNEALRDELDRQGVTLAAAQDMARGVQSDLTSAESRVSVLE
ncbi:MAG: hypothetical protein OXN15_03755, partial [Chloroflexota bacterium]|nr:hypothetical protein [Chloroflexota bacterium]